MNSLFPGMDPYIELSGLWEAFHGHLIEAIYQSIAPKLPSGYSVDTAVRSYIVLMEVEGKKEHLAKPDVTITEPTTKSRRPSKGGLALAERGETVESIPMQAFVAEEFEERFIEIYAEGERRHLVTCIEILSPSNKRPGTRGWRKYQRKRRAMLLGQANFIEMDLLRGGSKLPMLTPWPDSPYRLLICRADDAPYCRVWPASFQRRLPAIPVPLLEPDPDLTLDLQPLVDGIYSLGRYHERIDYTRPLSPRFSKAEAVWFQNLLKERSPGTSRKRRNQSSR